MLLNGDLRRWVKVLGTWGGLLMRDCWCRKLVGDGCKGRWVAYLSGN